VPHASHHTIADRATRAVAVITVSGLAGLAGWISYHHMLLLARRSGQTGIDAHAFPITVDGLDLIGVLVLLADRRTGRRSGWLPWTVLTVGTLASISANIAVAPDNLVARAISGWPAIALLAAAKMLAHLFEPAEPVHTQPPQPISRTTATQPPSDHPPANPETTGVQPEPPGRHHADIARRLPTGTAAIARWRTIWHATKHLDAATTEIAATHGISLRTLQFIRAAGEAGHLDPPTPQSSTTLHHNAVTKDVHS
jgi:hypothetical protein